MQAVECLADIRRRSGTSSVFLVFDSEQRGGESEQVGLALSGIEQPRSLVAGVGKLTVFQDDLDVAESLLPFLLNSAM